jgi:molecular chaperone GrpE
MDFQAKQQVIEEFCRFIEDLPAESEVYRDDENAVDLFTLFKEFTTLKSEVKLESRQFKTALESFKEVFHILQQSHDVLSRELEHRRQEQLLEIEKQRYSLLKPLLLDIIELRDRLKIATTHSSAYRPSWLERIFKRKAIFIASMSKGQAMTLRRVDQLLSTYEVHTINTIHQPFNPQLMQAVTVEYHPEFPDGVVTAEMNKGFIWKEEVLRVAKVKVNKIKG